MDRWRILCAGIALLAVSCAEAGTPADDDDDDSVDSGIAVVPDADPNAPDARPGQADAAPGTPDAPPGVPQSITLSQSTSETIVAENSVSCNGDAPDFYHADNSYYRVFDLNAMGVTSALTVTQVDVGIEDATGNGGSQPATLRLHTLTGAFTLANLTQVSSTPVTIPDQLASIHPIPVASAVVPAGSTLVVELFTPNGQTALHRFFAGSNNLGESGPTYLTAVDCAVTEPQTTASIGFPGMHWVVKVTGTHIP